MGGSTAEPIARSAHYRRAASLKRGVELALIVWPAFFFADLFLVTFVAPEGELRWFVLLRGLGQVTLVLAWLRLRTSRPPGPVQLFLIDAGVCTALSALITAGAAEYGGITTPLAVGVVTFLVGRSSLLADSSKRGVATLALPVLAYPATLLGLCAFVPEMAAQLSEPRALATFVFFSGFVAAGGLVAVLASQTAWRLEQEMRRTTSLGRYELIDRIGSGGMGEVWRARDQLLERDVALKLLRNPNVSPDPAIVRRFEREARATADLRHPNTVRVFDFGATEDGTLYYAMELLEGQDLNVLMQISTLTEDQVISIGAQTCASLAEAHRHGIVHRDIKPANIFLAAYPGEPMFVKLLDFGLAKAMEPGRPDGESLTRVGFAVGTPEFMAPEALLGEDIDGRADLYALGTILFTALTGRPPFKGPLKVQLQKRLSLPPPSPSHVAQRPVHRGLEAVLVKAIQNDPDHRFQHAMEMARALEACREPQPDDELETAEISTDRGLIDALDDPPTEETEVDESAFR